jgi:hypothetical protein
MLLTAGIKTYEGDIPCAMKIVQLTKELLGTNAKKCTFMLFPYKIIIMAMKSRSLQRSGC